MRGYKWGKKDNRDVDIKEKRSVILKGLRDEDDLKEINRKRAWARARGKRVPLSPAQKRSGARKVV